ncbi:MAG: tripartite tricarboxylate transporter permease [Gemmatimonadota bacterium]|nr:tripartite tricarboxylate transporter permease [Gemmatimonadota bacterium]
MATDPGLAAIVAAALEGLRLVLAWPNVLYPILGTLVAMCVAVLPGVSGATLLALAIPLTFSWEPLPVLLLFGALVGGATFMGSVTAILLNIPGTAPNAATLLDGHPMARNGEARTALACSATASALGSTVGVGVLVLCIPLVARLVREVGPPELLMLSLWGLVSVATVVRASLARGLATAGLGLMFSFVGLDPTTAEERFTLGTLYLQDGLPLVPVFVGIFAVAEVMDLVASGRRTIAADDVPLTMGGSIRAGMATVFRYPTVFLKSSVIGTLVGFVPGLGGTVAAFVAYGEAARSAGPDSRFGKGDVRGVLAPEAANDAKDGGSLLPVLAFGVPASTGTALLLAALRIHGVTPGVELMTEQLELVFVLIWSLFLSNWLTSLLGLSVAGPLSRLTTVSAPRLVAPILALSAMGAFTYRGRLEDVWVAFGFGALGFLMKRHGWPRIAFVIALILGPLFEQNLSLSLSLHRLGRIDLWTDPTILVGTALLVATAALPLLRGARRKPS